MKLEIKFLGNNIKRFVNANMYMFFQQLIFIDKTIQ